MNLHSCVSTSRPRCGPLLRFATLLWLTIASAFGQAGGTGIVTGRIINQATGEYLRNANVIVPGTNITAVAEAGGYYRLTGVPTGQTRIVASYTGLDPQEITVQVASGQTVARDIALTSASYTETVQLGQFVVSTAREGNAKAIMEQRNAENPKKVISADALGSVSEGNVGEFLKLMPGVAMDYVEADTRAMRVRGLNPKYANVLLDGMQMASAGSSNVGTGRAFEFEQLSIASVETVELTKAPTPDQPSSVAGTVNLRTKGAFDRKGTQLNVRAALSANSYYLDFFKKTSGWDHEEHYKTLPNLNVEYSNDSLLGGRLGLIAGANYSHTIAAQKHVWFFGNTFNNDFSDNDTEVGVVNRIWYQDGPKPTERGNYNVRLDYKLNDNVDVYGRVDYTTYDARFYNRTLSLRTNGGTQPGATHTDQTVVNGRISIDSNQFMTKEGDTVAFTSGGVYRAGNLTADLSAHYSKARNWYGNLEHGHFTDYSSSINNVSWRMTRPDRGSPDLNFTQLNVTATNDWRNINNYTFDPATPALSGPFGPIGWHERHSKDQQWTARLDFTHDLSRASIPQLIKFGALTNLKVLDVKRAGLLGITFAGPDRVVGTTDDPRPSSYVDPHFAADWGVGGNLNGFPALSPWKLYQRFSSNPQEFLVDTAAHDLARLRGNWDFKEKIHAAYVSDRLTFGKLDLSPGLRYEKTEGTGRGINTVTNSPIAGGNDYDAWLKYLHASYRLTPSLRLRASYHDAITRADIQNLIPGISNIDTTNARLTGTNPNLKEERSKSYNASLEYYFEPVGVVSVSVFHTEIKDRQFNNQTILGPEGYEGLPGTGGYTLTGPVNISVPTDYTGIELDYSQQLTFLPGMLRGLGVFANHTRVKFDDWAFNLGSPEVMTNGGLSFSHRRFSGRVNLNWVGKLLQNPARSYNSTTNVWTPGAPWIQIYQRDRLVTDLNLEYRLTDRFTLFLDGRNVLNEPSVYTYYGREENFERILHTGGIWMLGVKGRF
jgi:iron complex outermembrane recepter protein